MKKIYAFLFPAAGALLAIGLLVMFSARVSTSKVDSGSVTADNAIDSGSGQTSKGVVSATEDHLTSAGDSTSDDGYEWGISGDTVSIASVATEDATVGSISAELLSVSTTDPASTTPADDELTLDDFGTLSFAADTIGTTSFDGTDVVMTDGSSDTGGDGMVDLVTLSSRSSSLANSADMSLWGFDSSSDTSLGYGSDSMVLTIIPEPSRAMLLGLGGLAMILRRRRS